MYIVSHLIITNTRKESFFSFIARHLFVSLIIWLFDKHNHSSVRANSNNQHHCCPGTVPKEVPSQEAGEASHHIEGKMFQVVWLVQTFPINWKGDPLSSNETWQARLGVATAFRTVSNHSYPGIPQHLAQLKPDCSSVLYSVFLSCVSTLLSVI